MRSDGLPARTLHGPIGNLTEIANPTPSLNSPQATGDCPCGGVLVRFGSGFECDTCGDVIDE